eukprot:scaffold55691_cov48-Attheya_sp.AAC.1
MFCSLPLEDSKEHLTRNLVVQVGARVNFHEVTYVRINLDCLLHPFPKVPSCFRITFHLIRGVFAVLFHLLIYFWMAEASIRDRKCNVGDGRFGGPRCCGNSEDWTGGNSEDWTGGSGRTAKFGHSSNGAV